MERFWRIYDWIEHVATFAALAATVLTVLAAAVGRAAGSPVVAAQSFALLFLLWTVMLGADLAMKRGGHIRVSALADMSPEPVRRTFAAVNLALILPFLGFIAWMGWDLAMGNWERELGASGLSYGLVTLALPVGAALLAITILRRLVGLGLLATLEPEDRSTKELL